MHDNPKYHSFLICNHPTHTDIYVNGLPIGSINNGAFHPKKLEGPKSETFESFQQIPFDSQEAFTAYLNSVISLISFKKS